jgi:hypothetical protein
MGRLELRSGRQPCGYKVGRYRGGRGSLQERQRPGMAQQAAMVGRVVRLFLGCQRQGLTHQRQTDQEQDCYPDAIFARADVPRLSEY